MRLEYDPLRDLLYLYFAESTQKAAKTVTVVPGLNANFNRQGKLIGIEILDASKTMGQTIEFTRSKVVTRPTLKV